MSYGKAWIRNLPIGNSQQNSQLRETSFGSSFLFINYTITKTTSYSKCIIFSDMIKFNVLKFIPQICISDII